MYDAHKIKQLLTMEINNRNSIVKVRTYQGVMRRNKNKTGLEVT